MIKEYQTKSNVVINAWFIFILLVLGLTSIVKADCFKQTLDKQSDFSDCVKLSNRGNVSAQYNLGLMFSVGLGTTQDYKKAFEWYKKAAEQGYAPAQYNLGSMFVNGQGTTEDHKQAFEWYKKAAEQGEVDAHDILGAMFYSGQGTTQDYVMAHMHWNVAASSGKESAKEYRILVEKSMTSSQVEKAQELAREWVDKH